MLKKQNKEIKKENLANRIRYIRGFSAIIIILGAVLYLYHLQLKSTSAIIRQDGPVEFLEKVPFTDRDADLYAQLDRIESWENSPYKIETYRSIEISPMTEMDELRSRKGEHIYYFGFSECKYCKAFTPKVDWLVQNLKDTEQHVEINYINTRQLSNETVEALKSEFNFEYVPTMIWLSDGEEKLSVDYNSTMEQLENFIMRYLKAAQKNNKN